jgi:DNA-binding CsgD family transcriptional regulator
VRRSLPFIALTLLQFACGVFLLWDILSSVLGLKVTMISWALYELVEIGAILGLILGTLVSAGMVARSLRRQRQVEQSLQMASGAFMDVLNARFAEWRLSPAEKDVALFAIKGMSTAEIAELRETSPGTVKAQTNAIYRKAGVSGRTQLLSLFVDALIEGPIR